MYKKTLTLLTATMLFGICVAQQKSVPFKVKYLPQHKYVMNTSMNVNMTMDLKGDSADVAAAKKGASFPIKMTMEGQTGITISAGAKSPGKATFPLHVKYDKFDLKQVMNGQPMNTGGDGLAGVEFDGWSNGDGQLHIDTSKGKKDMTSALLRGIAAKMINDMGIQLKFPEKPMQIGDTFEQKINGASPLAANMKYDLTTVYKLLSVSNGIANFSLIQTAGFDINQKTGTTTLNMKGNGNGDGSMKYDIAKNFVTAIENNFTLSYNMQVEKVTMVASANTKSSTVIAVSRK